MSSGERSHNVISLEDDKKHVTFSNEDPVRCYEGLKLAVHANMRKGVIGHAVASPFAHVARAVP